MEYSATVKTLFATTALDEARASNASLGLVQLLSDTEHLRTCAKLGIPSDEFALVASKFTMPDGAESVVPLAILTRHGETPLRAHAAVLAGLGGVLAHHFKPPEQGGFPVIAPILTDQEPWRSCKLTTVQVLIGDFGVIFGKLVSPILAAVPEPLACPRVFSIRETYVPLTRIDLLFACRRSAIGLFGGVPPRVLVLSFDTL